MTAFGQSAEQSSPKPILIVDDNDQVRYLMARALKDAGYTVLEASDGPSALDLLAEGFEIQLLVTDILMPGLSGLEVASHVMAAFQVPVLFVSAHAQQSAEIPGPILWKPFTSAMLVDTVKRLLAVTGSPAKPAI
jgi:CheY-like chemotaxis protein